jgi:hypothetical protein
MTGEGWRHEALDSRTQRQFASAQCLIPKIDEGCTLTRLGTCLPTDYVRTLRLVQALPA